MSEFLQTVVDNIVFVIEFIALVAAIVAVAYGAEKGLQKLTGTKQKILTTQRMALIGMFSAVAGVLMLFEIPVVFAPAFYKIDLSEIPVLICGFACGPVAGVLTEFIKILVKLMLKGTSTAFVGELANFCVGCTMVLPATILHYAFKKKKLHIQCIVVGVGCILGTIVMTAFGAWFNAVYLLPKFAVMYGMPMNALIGMGTAINASVTNVFTFAAFCVAPLNLLKGIIVSTLTILIYIPLRVVIYVTGAEKTISRRNTGKVA